MVSFFDGGVSDDGRERRSKLTIKNIHQLLRKSGAVIKLCRRNAAGMAVMEVISFGAVLFRIRCDKMRTDHEAFFVSVSTPGDARVPVPPPQSCVRVSQILCDQVFHNETLGLGDVTTDH